MKLNIYIDKTALYLAIEKGNIEIIKLLLKNNELDINCININIAIFSYNYKSNILIKSKFKYFDKIHFIF